MALMDLAMQYMGESANQPTLYDRTTEHAQKRDTHNMNQRIGLSQLSNDELNRQSVQQELGQKGYEFDLAKERMAKYRQIIDMMNATDDLAKKQELSVRLAQEVLAGGDSQLLHGANALRSSFNPAEQYGNQQQMFDAELADKKLQPDLTKAQIGAYNYRASGGAAGNKTPTVKYTSMESDERDLYTQSMANQSWFDSLDGSKNKKGVYSSDKAAAQGDVLQGMEYISQYGAMQGVGIPKDQAYTMAIRAAEKSAEPGFSFGGVELGDKKWNKDSYRQNLQIELSNLLTTGEASAQPATPAPNTLFKDEATGKYYSDPEGLNEVDPAEYGM